MSVPHNPQRQARARKEDPMNRLNQIKNEANLLDINETVVELIKVYEYVNGIKVEE